MQKAIERSLRHLDKKQKQIERLTKKHAQTLKKTRVQSEQERISAEEERTQNEQSRINAESQRASAETNRATAETARAEAETNRINAEQSRIDNETLRVTAEQERVNAENARAKAEANREGTINKLREDVDNNTKEDARTARSLCALWDLNKGISYRFETDTTNAYQKTFPTGAKLGTVNKVGGKTIVYNQLIDPSRRKEIDFDEQTKHFKYSDWAVTAGNKYICTDINMIGGHKYYLYATDKVRYSLLKMYGDSVSIAFTKPEDAETKVKSIFTATNSGKNRLYFNRDLANPENVSRFDGCINLIDLTQMFGSGNEPTTVEEFEAMFPNDYYPYNEGELMSMSVNKVENVGKNKFECHNYSCLGFKNNNSITLSNNYGTAINSSEPSNSVTVTQSSIGQSEVPTSYKNGYFCILINTINLNKDYVFFLDVTPSKKLIEDSKVSILLNGNDLITCVGAQELQIGKRTKLYFNLIKGDKKVLYIEIRNSGISGTFENFQIEEGTTATDYSPYKKETYEIPQAVLDLEGYGWSSGTAYNYVDFENKKFVKNVERVDLSTMAFVYTAFDDNSYLRSFRAPLPRGIKQSESANAQKNNLLCIRYPDTAWQDAYKGLDKTISQLSQSIHINDSSFTDEEAFKNSLQGVYLYYELAEPVVTDISDIIEDTFQEPFKVEIEGLLTFKNINGDGYKLAVPNEEQYTIKLSEVTS